MLPGDDMLDMMGRLGMLLGVQAILATVARALANELPRGFIHQSVPCSDRKRRAFNLIRLTISAPST